MELYRTDEETDEGTVLVDTRLVPSVGEVCVFWDRARGNLTDPGYVTFGVAVGAGGPAGTPRYSYEVTLDADELGELLSYFPAQAIPGVVDRWLASAAPEVVGALAGCIAAHLARARGNSGGQVGPPG